MTLASTTPHSTSRLNPSRHLATVRPTTHIVAMLIRITVIVGLRGAINYFQWSTSSIVHDDLYRFILNTQYCSYPVILLQGRNCSSAVLAQRFYFCFSFFSVFSFLNRFPLQLFLVLYSYLSTLLLVCFSVNQPHYHRFLSVFFVFHKLLVLTR